MARQTVFARLIDAKSPIERSLAGYLGANIKALTSHQTDEFQIIRQKLTNNDAREREN